MRDWTIKETTNLSRIDVFLQSETEFSRNYIQNLIKEGLVLVNEKTTKANYNIKPGDVVVMV
ncbi:MAG: RluA family pseudouridine synthase, partial [Acholeplasmataceae bacterium]|nr:RluA family pseudouridine synthase [Acholeplasmataceae bacterium]